MNINKLFPRRYASGQDLAGKSPIVTISHVEVEVMRPTKTEEARKPVIYFQEAEKGIILSRTLANQIAEITGSTETDTWTGHKVQLFTVALQIAKQDKLSIRARTPEVK